MRDELLAEIRVKLLEACSVEGRSRKIVMIPFTGEATGPYFTGSVTGTGTDTQKIEKDGSFVLPARYMLRGTDYTGKACSIFIENTGSPDTGFRPSVVTDSAALSGWETAELTATVDGTPEGVLVRIYKKTGS